MRKAIVIFVAVIAAVAVGITASLTVFSKDSRYARKIEEANKFLSDGEYSEAILSFDKAINIDDKHAEVWLAKIELQKQISDIEGAMETTTQLFDNRSEYYYDIDTEKINEIATWYIDECIEAGLPYDNLKSKLEINGWVDVAAVLSYQEVITRLKANPKNIEYADTYTGTKQDPTKSYAESFVDFKMLEMDGDGIDELVCWWGSTEMNSITVSVYRLEGGEYKLSATMNFSHGDPSLNSGKEYFVQREGGYQILSWSSHNTWYKSYSVFKYNKNDFEAVDGYTYNRNITNSMHFIYELYKYNPDTEEDIMLTNSDFGDSPEEISNQYDDFLKDALKNSIEILRETVSDNTIDGNEIGLTTTSVKNKIYGCESASRCEKCDGICINIAHSHFDRCTKCGYQTQQGVPNNSQYVDISDCEFIFTIERDSVDKIKAGIVSEESVRVYPTS